MAKSAFFKTPVILPSFENSTEETFIGLSLNLKKIDLSYSWYDKVYHANKLKWSAKEFNIVLEIIRKVDHGGHYTSRLTHDMLSQIQTHNKINWTSQDFLIMLKNLWRVNKRLNEKGVYSARHSVLTSLIETDKSNWTTQDLSLILGTLIKVDQNPLIKQTIQSLEKALTNGSK